MSTPEPTRLTVRDREELAASAGLLSGIARSAASTPRGKLNRDGLLDALQRAVAGIDGVLARDLARRAAAQRSLCGQDTREAGSRVTVQCALPAGHAGLCSAEEEGL